MNLKSHKIRKSEGYVMVIEVWLTLSRLHTWQCYVSSHVLIAVASIIAKFQAIGSLQVKLC